MDSISTNLQYKAALKLVNLTSFHVKFFINEFKEALVLIIDIKPTKFTRISFLKKL